MPNRSSASPAAPRIAARSVLDALARAALLAGLLAWTPAAGHAGLNGTEKSIVESVDRGVPAATKLLRRAVEINSGTMNIPGVRKVGFLFEPEFAKLGFKTHWVEGAAWGRAGHLMCERHSRPGALRVLLIGHLDTVFEPSSPFKGWKAVGDTAARGPGVTDMKGGNVVMLLALGALRDAGRLDDLDITVILTGDEEMPGKPFEVSRRRLLEAARRSEVAIGFEDGAGDPRTAVIARRGSTSWRLGVWSQPAHSSQVFQPGVGEGAIFTTARLLRAFRDSLAGEELLTINPGAIVGGTNVTWEGGESGGTAFGKNNVVAESTIVAGDLRATSEAQRARAKAMMSALAAGVGPNARATIEFDDGYPTLEPTEGNRWLLARFDDVSRDMGAGPVTAVSPRNAGAADISFTQGLTPMAIDGVGMMGAGGHTTAETADLRSMPLNAKRVAILIARLMNSPRPLGAERAGR